MLSFRCVKRSVFRLFTYCPWFLPIWSMVVTPFGFWLGQMVSLELLMTDGITDTFNFSRHPSEYVPRDPLLIFNESTDLGVEWSPTFHWREDLEIRDFCHPLPRIGPSTIVDNFRVHVYATTLIPLSTCIDWWFLGGGVRDKKLI